MLRKIVFAFLAIVVVLSTSFSIFWLLKVSALKNNIKSLNLPKISVSFSSISSSGFPFKQIISVDNLAIGTDISLFSSKEVFIKDYIQIDNLKISSGIFSNHFTISLSEKIQFKENKSTHNIKFNQDPEINFIAEDGLVKSFLYQDQGYKIIDIANNVLFNNGNTKINFKSKSEGINNEIINLVATFKDIGNIDILAELDEISKEKSIANNVTDKLENEEDLKLVDEVLIEQDDPLSQIIIFEPQEELIVEKYLSYKDLNIRELYLDLEFILKNSSNNNEELPDLGTENVVIDLPKHTIESFRINNLEFNNSIYKAQINGYFIKIIQERGDLSSLDFSLKIEGFDAILGYIEQTFNPFRCSKNSKITNINRVDLESSLNKKLAQVEKSEIVNEKEKLLGRNEFKKNSFGSGIAQIMQDVAKKNDDSTGKIAIFAINQDEGFFNINGIPSLRIGIRYGDLCRSHTNLISQ